MAVTRFEPTLAQACLWQIVSHKCTNSRLERISIIRAVEMLCAVCKKKLSVIVDISNICKQDICLGNIQEILMNWEHVTGLLHLVVWSFAADYFGIEIQSNLDFYSA